MAAEAPWQGTEVTEKQAAWWTRDPVEEDHYNGATVVAVVGVPNAKQVVLPCNVC